jgi:hypothetical protein
MWKFLQFVIEFAIVIYAFWLGFIKADPTIKDVIGLCSLTLITVMIVEGKVKNLVERNR